MHGDDLAYSKKKQITVERQLIEITYLTSSIYNTTHNDVSDQCVFQRACVCEQNCSSSSFKSRYANSPLAWLCEKHPNTKFMCLVLLNKASNAGKTYIRHGTVGNVALISLLCAPYPIQSNKAANGARQTYSTHILAYSRIDVLKLCNQNE